MISRKWFPSMFRGIALAAISLAAASSAQAQSLRIGTATEGGVWYILGSGFAQVVGEALKAPVTPVTTAGALENLRRLNSGTDLQLGLVAATSIAGVVKDGTVKPQNVKVVGAGHGNYTQIIVRKDSGITTWTDALKPGRSVGVGEPGSAAFEMARAAIEAVGSGVDKVKAARLGHQAQADAFKNRQIEVMVVSPGIPTAAVADALTTANGMLLAASEDEVKAIVAKNPAEARGVIPANTYDNQPQPILTVMLPSLMFISAGQSEDTAYKVTKAIYENTDRLKKVHVNGGEWTLQNALTSRDFLASHGFEYHPGTIRYYKDKGIW